MVSGSFLNLAIWYEVRLSRYAERSSLHICLRNPTFNARFSIKAVFFDFENDSDIEARRLNEVTYFLLAEYENANGASCSNFTKLQSMR
ncbi:DEKNAAC104696 [Brettanomyces naardenensis]|uniref:DEKNAAC104696 n=1 Tax=Brettanomyces naardenensis TaxID=13370 RepID=A0A448YRA5_BRENA|nr:DEKNAAC104696 [Brettanomyces naardenensis]